MAESKNGGNDDKKESGRKSAYQIPDDSKQEAAGETTGKATDEATDAEVVDLDQKRAAAQETGTSLLEGALGDSLKAAVRQFMLQNVVPEGQKSGDVDLNLDVDFLRKHGRDMVTSVFQSLAKTIFPEKMELKLGKKAGEGSEDEKPEGGAEAVAKGEPRISMNFDFLEFIKGLMTPPTGDVTPAAPAAEAAEATADDQGEPEGDEPTPAKPKAAKPKAKAAKPKPKAAKPKPKKAEPEAKTDE